MEMFDEDQRKDLIFEVLEPEDISKFWNILSHKRRMDLWASSLS
jgi:hypothetical protein